MDYENNYILQTTPIFIFILLIAGNYIGELLPCKVQNFIKNNMYFKHLLGFMTLLFFVVVTMPSVFGDKIIFNSFILYIFYLFFIKTHYVFWSINVVLFSIIYLADIHLGNVDNIKDNNKDNNSVSKEMYVLFEQVRRIMLVIIIILTILGFLVYLGKKKREYGKKFTYLMFFLGSPSCRGTSPNIKSYLEEIKYSFK